MLLIFSGCSLNEPDSKKELEVQTAELVTIPEKIQFPSEDSLLITANLYHVSDSAPTIVLCHQARYNKFEYTGIARTLHEMGYNCLAIDQRSGGGLVEEFNETMLEAERNGKPVEFLDAEQDINAAVNFAANKYDQKIILWGSSYSSTLSLYIAIANPNVKAVISFSPGDYFQDEKGSLQSLLIGFSKPMFVTSSREEAAETTALLSQMKLLPGQMQFIPDSAGFHGSRALWRTSKNNEEYWLAVTNFLKNVD
jgi:dienelactone hydrolase